ncbi:hypothetical protein KCP71_04605 [Salmonella enterica subsp. enterica]|nr:hypothetical protein KCP71_04605 [Salmonella enterica subsp. enterica]
MSRWRGTAYHAAQEWAMAVAAAMAAVIIAAAVIWVWETGKAFAEWRLRHSVFHQRFRQAASATEIRIRHQQSCDPSGALQPCYAHLYR